MLFDQDNDKALPKVKVPKMCGLNIFVNYDKFEDKGTHEPELALGVFNGTIEENYPFNAPAQCMNESNFDNIEHQIERVDYNFYDEYLMGAQPREADDQIDSSQDLSAAIKRVQMQEQDAFKLYNQIFDDSKGKINLDLPVCLQGQ